MQDAHAKAAKIVTDRLQELEMQERVKLTEEKARIERERQAVAAKTQAKEAALRAAQELRKTQENAERAMRLKTGLRGFWQKLTGARKKAEAENKQGTTKAEQRDQSERADLQREKAQTLTRAEKLAAFIKERRQSNIQELRQDRQTLTPAFKGEAEPERHPSNNEVKRDAFKKRRTRTPTKDRPKRSQSRLRLAFVLLQSYAVARALPL